MEDPIPYVKSFTDMKGNKKFRKLERRNRDLAPPLLVGLIHFLWHHVARESPTTGEWNLAETHPSDVFEMDEEFSERFVSELVEAEFLERRGPGVVAIANWQEIYDQFLRRRRTREDQPRDGSGKFLPVADREEPSPTVTDRNGTVNGHRDGPLTATKPNLKEKKEGQEGHGRDSRRERREKFVGDLTGDPAKWKRLPKHPSDCGYTAVLMSPVAELDEQHLCIRMVYCPAIAEDNYLEHRMFFTKNTQPSVLLVAWPDAEWVDDEPRRQSLRTALEEMGYDPWGAIAPRIKSYLPRGVIRDGPMDGE